MSKLNRTNCIKYNLRGGLSLPTAVGASPLIAKKTGGCTVLGVSGGGTQIALDATNEVQNGTIYMGDVLPFPIAKLQKVHFLMACSAALDASIQAVWGVAAAENADPDAIAAGAWFKLAGSNAIVCETDDGTTDKNDIPTGMSLDATPRWFTIDFETGVTRAAPPAQSKGHGSNILFFGEQDRVNLMQVAKNTHFDMSSYSGNLQPFIRLQKTAGVATGTLRIDELWLEHVC